MTQAIRALTGHARQFVEGWLNGLYRWDDIRLHELEPAPLRSGNRRAVNGKYIERITLVLGPFMLTLASTEVAPPVGLIELTDRRSGEVCSGPLDRTTWDKAAVFIKQRSKATCRP